ncbi:hypothetical protein D9M69_703860 [compost metagenome]
MHLYLLVWADAPPDNRAMNRVKNSILFIFLLQEINGYVIAFQEVVFLGQIIGGLIKPGFEVLF